MTEFGIFNDEGCVEDGFPSKAEAWDAIEDHYSEEDDLAVLEICPVHDGEPKEYCEDCQLEEDHECD